MTEHAPHRDCQKKDKRLLVLLALGILLLMSSNNRAGSTGREFSAPNWLEIHAEKKAWYRCTEPAQFERLPQTRVIASLLQDRATAGSYAESLERQSAAAVHKDKSGNLRLAALSPKLVFLLGQPLPVNIAEVGELTLVPGIGPYLADNIMEYRRRHGRIDSKKELTAVRGIGKARAEKLSAHITFE